MSKQCNRKRLFQQFLVNLEVWGSYQTLGVNRDGVYGVQYARRATEAQINDVMESLMDTFKEVNFEKYPVLKHLVNKTGIIGYLLAKIQCHIITKNGGIAPSMNIPSGKYLNNLSL